MPSPPHKRTALSADTGVVGNTIAAVRVAAALLDQAPEFST